MSTIHRDDSKPVGYDYPLPVIISGESGNSFSANLVTNNATTPILVKQATASKTMYLTDIILSSSAANRVDLRDVDGTVIFTVYLGASSPFQKTFTTPKEVTAGKNLLVKSATAVNLAVSVDGYIK